MSRRTAIPAATLPVAASEGEKGVTGRRGGHALCRPASPGAIIAKAIADSGRDSEWLRVVAAACECERWDEEEREMAKERGR